MARRDIRRLLMEPKRKPQKNRPWAVPALMLAVLGAGVAIGAGVGLGIMASRTETEQHTAWERAEMEVSRPPRRESLLEPSEPVAPPVVPLVPVPPPRPGGPADDSFAPQVPLAAPPGTQLAALPKAVAPPPSETFGATPAWVRYAVPPPKSNGKPMIAVVIDDLGVDRKRSERVVGLRAPLTLAWMTYAENLPAITREARAKGHELMLHVPMQPQGASYDPGPDVLEVRASAEENRRRLVWGLRRFEGFVGINNHMGSKFTQDPDGMRVVMEEVKRRGLLFLDSMTTGKSVGAAVAQRFGVPFAARNIFLDNEQSVAAVKAQLAKTEAHARKTGMAIAIGHPHDTTIEALAGWLPGLEAKGFQLVPVTAIVRAQSAP